MKDILGKPTSVGDFVVVTKKNYRDMVIGVVLKVTPKKILVQYSDTHGIKQYLTTDFIKINDSELNLISNEILDKIDSAGNYQFKKFVSNTPVPTHVD